MKKQLYKLSTKAFTIVELLVVLIISTIIIGMGTSIYLKVEKYLEEEFLNPKVNNEQIWFLNRLEDEIKASDYVIGNKRQIHIVKDSTLDVTYQINFNHTIRQTHYSKDSIRTSYAIESIVYLEEIPEYISGLEIRIGGKDTINTITINKKYLPFVIINALTNFDKPISIKKWD